MSDTTKVYGTETIKMVLEAGFTVVSKVENAKADDGKVDWMEGAGIAAGSISDIYGIVKNGSQIKKEYNDLDDEEREDIIIWFAEKFDLSNDQAEEKVEAIFKWIVVTDETITIVLKKD